MQKYNIYLHFLLVMLVRPAAVICWSTKWGCCMCACCWQQSGFESAGALSGTHSSFCPVSCFRATSILDSEIWVSSREFWEKERFEGTILEEGRRFDFGTEVWFQWRFEIWFWYDLRKIQWNFGLIWGYEDLGVIWGDSVKLFGVLFLHFWS